MSGWVGWDANRVANTAVLCIVHVRALTAPNEWFESKGEEGPDCTADECMVPKLKWHGL